MQAPGRKSGRNLKCMRRVDGHTLVKEAVAAHPVSAEIRHRIRDLKRRPAIHARSLHPSCLRRRVIGHLVLEKDFGAAISVPDHFVLLVMLYKQTIRRYIVET